MLHHQRYYDGEHRYHHVEHHYRAGLLEVVLAEQGYVHGEEQHQHAYEYCLSDDGCRHLVLGGAASLHLSLKR